MRLPLAMVIASLLATGCPPWYRDAERSGRLVLDETRTARELERARADRKAGHPERTAAILRATVHRNPKVDADVWVELVEAEVAAGEVTTARAHARWQLARLDAGDPRATLLRAALIRSLASDGLVAPALDLLDAQTLDAAVAHPALAELLGELVTAMKQVRYPDMARVRLGAWLRQYGEPDHPILRAAREQIAAALWEAAAAPDAPPAVAALRGFPELIRDELDAGHTAAALIAYAEARRFLPDAVAARLDTALQRAALAAGITALAPDVHAQAVAGDTALQRGDLGSAISSYRAVVLRAPWWAAARNNLDALLAAAASR